MFLVGSAVGVQLSHKFFIQNLAADLKTASPESIQVAYLVVVFEGA